MFGYFVLTANMAYGAWQCAGMWKRGKPRESVVIGMLSLIVAAYFIPPISDYMPTVESFHARIYRPLSNHMIRLFGVSAEVSDS